MRADLTTVNDVVGEWPADFLRGLYDSEGNLSSANGYPSVRIFSQRSDVLGLAIGALNRLGLHGTTRIFRRAGTIVRLPGGRECVSRSHLLYLAPTPTRRFLAIVGSSIPRKQALV